MARLLYIEPERADPLTSEVYEKAKARFQMILNIFKITGHVPQLGAKMWEIFFTILQDGHVKWPTKELLILKTVKKGDCLYCVTQHEVVAERLGVGPEKQAELVGRRYRTSPRFTPEERAILNLNDEMLADARRISPTTWSEVKKYWRDDQIVEILATIGAYIQVSKFGDSLGVELEPVFHGRSSVLFREEPPTSPAAARHLEHFERLSAEHAGQRA